MEKVSIQFSADEVIKIERFRLENETLESAVKRLILAYISGIPNKVWSNNEDDIFNEFEETFQKLGE
ncbi:MAG: hypothetical protein GPJ54_16775 [Candidatus Heimdallarchaeota archaeon]|nr:hypothetical protein [Candidatus Heimdallarchaeota archaeon]